MRGIIRYPYFLAAVCVKAAGITLSISCCFVCVCLLSLLSDLRLESLLWLLCRKIPKRDRGKFVGRASTASSLNQLSHVLIPALNSWHSSPFWYRTTIAKEVIAMSTFLVDASAGGAGHDRTSQHPRQQQEENRFSEHKASPTHKRDNSLNTCSLSSGADDVGSCTEQEDQPPSVCEAVNNDFEYEEPQTPQGVERILSVDMFSRFATAYSYPIDGEYDDQYSSDDEEDVDTYDNNRGDDIETKTPTSYNNDSDSGESQNRYRSRYNNNAWSQQSGFSLDGEKFIENEDAEIENDVGDVNTTTLPYHFRRGHRRVNSFPWKMDETKEVSTPPMVDKGLVTPSPPKVMKKKAPVMVRRSRSMSNTRTDLNDRYGSGEEALPSGATTPPRVPGANTTGADGCRSHHRVVSAHSPLSDLLEITSLSASPRPPRPTCLPGGASPRLRPRNGLPPRPVGHPITLSPHLSWSEPESIERKAPTSQHKRSHSAPMIPSPRSTTSTNSCDASQISAGPATQHHLRSFSYGNFKALHDASETLYLSQIPLNTSPDPSLLGSRPRHHTRNHSLDSRSTAMSTKSKESTVSAASEVSQAESDAEQKWNKYYEHKMVKRNVVKDEFKYRLSKAIPKGLAKRISPSPQPELKRADSAKFV